MTWLPSSPALTLGTHVTPRKANGTVAVIGSINVDRTVTAARFPRPGETILGTGVETTVGGKGANQAVAAARAGAHTVFIGRVGDDEAADFVLNAFASEGLDVHTRQVIDAPTGTAWITVAEGDNHIVVVPGANHSWDRLDDVTEAAANADVVLIQGEIPLQVIRQAAKSARNTVVLNAAPVFPVDSELLAAVDVLVVNEHELGELSRRAVASDGDVFAAQRTLRSRGARAVITTRGPDPVLSTIDGREIRTPAPRAQNVVDTTGAGDAFCGVLAARLAAGAPIERAIHWAAAAGSVSVATRTAQGSYPDYERLRALTHTSEVAR